MSDIMANTSAAHLNTLASRYSILPRSQPNANDPIFCSTPSFLIARVIYFYCKNDCDKTSFLACRCLFWRGPKARNKEKKMQQLTSPENSTEKKGLQSTLLDLIASTMERHAGGEARPTASSLCAVLMTSLLPSALSLMTLLIASVNRVKESVPPLAGNKNPLSTSSKMWSLTKKRSFFSHFTLFLQNSLSSALCLSFKNLKYLEEAQNKT